MVISDKAQDPDWLEPEGWLLEHHPVTSSPTNQRKVPHPASLQANFACKISSLASPQQHSSASAGGKSLSLAGELRSRKPWGYSQNLKNLPTPLRSSPILSMNCLFSLLGSCSKPLSAPNFSILVCLASLCIGCMNLDLTTAWWLWKTLLSERRQTQNNTTYMILFIWTAKQATPISGVWRQDRVYLWGRERRQRWDRTQIAPGVLVTFCFSIWLLVIWICLWKFFMTIHFWLVYTFYMCHTSIKRFLKIPLLGLIWGQVVKTLLFQCRGLGLISCRGTKILHAMWCRQKIY